MKLGKTVSIFEEVIQHFAKVLQSECHLGLQHPFETILPLQSYIILQLIEKQKNRWSSGRGIERPRYSIFEVCKDMFNDDLAAREEGVALSIGIAQNAVFGLFFGKITATVCLFFLYSPIFAISLILRKYCLLCFE